MTHLLHVRARNTRVAVRLGISAPRLFAGMGEVARAPVMNVPYRAR